MDIYIKSFNRPYLLERCIYTVKKFVSDYGKIIVLDDGTPQKYLDKLQVKYPEIHIKKSEFYKDKSTAIEQQKNIKDKLKFPGKFWHSEIIMGSDYLFLLEDDFFITKPLQLGHIELLMRQKELHQYKMIWLGRKEYKPREIYTVQDNEIIIAKSRFFTSENFRHITKNKFKLRAIFEKHLGRNSYFKYWVLPFYKFYTVAGAVYSRRLFDEMWNGIENLNESIQIYRMIRFHENNNIKLKIGKSKHEMIQTTFLSSATNDFPEIDFSIFEFNSIINEAWYNDKFNSIFRFPRDYGRDYYKEFLSEKMQIEYDRWIDKFSFGYRNLGCEVIIN